MKEFATIPGAIQPRFPLEHLIITLRDIDAYYTWVDKQHWLVDPDDEYSWQIPRHYFVRLGDLEASSCPDLHQRLKGRRAFSGEVTFVVLDKEEHEASDRSRALRAVRELLHESQVVSVRWAGDITHLEELLPSLPPQRKAR